MKKVFCLFLFLPLFCFAASQDFVTGVDWTGRSNITQVAIMQTVNNAYPATNKGLVIVTNGAPSVLNDPKLARYIWNSNGTLYTYNTNSGVWTTTALAAGSVGTAQLADGAVSTVKIANSAVDNSKLADDSVTSAKIVPGTIATSDLADNSVTRDKIYPSAIGSGQITNSAISGTNIASGSISNSHLDLRAIQMGNTNIGAGAIANTNIQASAIQNTNIATGSISNNLIASGELSYSKFNTNATLMIPRYWMIIDSSGTIAAQAAAPGLSPCTAAAIATGIFTITFGTAMSSTNYVVNISSIADATTTTYGHSIRTNTTTAVTYITETVGGVASSRPAMVTIYGF